MRPFTPVPIVIGALVALVSTPTTAVAAPGWHWPIAGPHAIVRPYLAPSTAYSAGHRGIDVSATSSVDVRAPADGVIHFSGYVVDRPVISIDHGNGVISSFEHALSTLHTGDRVTAGQVIAQVQPGHCTSPCLHFGVRIDGAYVSPLLLLGGIPHSVLLPTRHLRRVDARSRSSP
jgi:murein DD-endopeptidase MepM/ murein hydrolase activator NlpD